MFEFAMEWYFLTWCNREFNGIWIQNSQIIPPSNIQLHDRERKKNLLLWLMICNSLCIQPFNRCKCSNVQTWFKCCIPKITTSMEYWNIQMTPWLYSKQKSLFFLVQLWVGNFNSWIQCRLSSPFKGFPCLWILAKT